MFLGIDCSTQSMKIIVINEIKDILAEVNVNYDSELPYYNTKNGVVRFFEKDIEHIYTPTLLFIEALELALEKLSKKFNLSKIKGISGSGQQHGSVWWKNNTIGLLQRINDSEIDVENNNLCNLLKDSFSLTLSPIWMDNSTTVESIEITKGKIFLILFYMSIIIMKNL
jgi:xylulokinase